MPLTVLSLCSGVGGLDLGIKLALPEARVVAYVEKDDYCRRVLTARMADGWLDEGPIYEDLREFDGREWRGRVDLVCGGFPCQPWSQAGRRQGAADERWLWPHIARVVGAVEPSLVFLENVPGLLVHGGLGAVLGDLARLGFDAEWGLLSACAVGAPHTRERLFVLAHTASIGRERRWMQEPQEALLEAGGCRVETDGPWSDKPASFRVAPGFPSRVDRLRALGNAVVPLVAAHALRTLAARIGEEQCR